MKLHSYKLIMITNSFEFIEKKYNAQKKLQLIKTHMNDVENKN